MSSTKKTATWLLSLVALAIVVVAILSDPKFLPTPKEQVQRNTEILSVAQRTDLICFNREWFIVVQNHKNGEQITLKSSMDKSINTYPYSIIAGYKNFRFLSNPNPNNDYSKTLLNYFVGISN